MTAQRTAVLQTNCHRDSLNLLGVIRIKILLVISVFYRTLRVARINDLIT